VVALGGAAAPTARAADAVVCAAAASDPVKFFTGELPDAADDAAVFIHPTERGKSTYIGVNKLPGGGLSVYDLSGKEIQFVAAGADNRWNNDDLRYNFPLGGKKVTLLAATNRQQNTIDFWTIDEATGKVNTGGVGRVTVTGSGVKQAHGLALYHSPVSGKYFAFVDYQGAMAQIELDGSSGSVTGKLVRGSWNLGNASEGIVADDERKVVYLAKETSAGAAPDDTGGIDRFGAEPGDSKTPLRIDSTTDNKTFAPGHIEQDVKGLALYYASDGAGYLIATSQGGDDYHVYDRAFTPGAVNTWRGSFAVNGGSCPSQDKLTATDGIDVTNANLGGAFATGMFVVQDDKMDGGTQNYKMVPWGEIASKLHLGAPDTTFNPRGIGGDGTPWTPTDPAPDPKPGTGTGTGGGTGTGTAPGGGTPAGSGGVLGTTPVGGLPTSGGGAATTTTPGDATSPAATAFGAKPGISTSISKSKGVRADKQGKVRFTLVNANAFNVAATVRLESTTGTRLAKTLKVTVASKKTVALRLSTGARKALKRGSRKVELSLRLRDPRGNVRQVLVTFRLRAAA
jgi:myo-inositol-hexaphosphate 3-phosphohydrolase